MEANVEAIKASPYQPRYLFNLDDLESEIKKDGLLSDLVVRRKGDFYVNKIVRCPRSTIQKF